MSVFEVRWLRVHDLPTFAVWCREVWQNVRGSIFWRIRRYRYEHYKGCKWCSIRQDCYVTGIINPKTQCPGSKG